MYRLAYDSAAGIVRMSVSGFWTVATVEAMFAELVPLLTKVKASGRPVYVISDASKFPVQSVEVGEAFARLDADCARLRNRMAIVLGSMLNRLQARRFNGVNIEYFTSLANAEHWVLTGVDLEKAA